MSSAPNITPETPAPSGTGKKPRAAGKQKAAKGIFGLLPEWTIDTRALKDELRD